MTTLEYPANLKYTTTDEWVRVEGDRAFIGITDYAQDQLGDIVYIELPWDGGQSVARGAKFGDIESVKATSELISPVSGDVVSTNTILQEHPEQINESPYEGGWILAVKMSHSDEIDSLMSGTEYTAYIEGR